MCDGIKTHLSVGKAGFVKKINFYSDFLLLIKQICFVQWFVQNSLPIRNTFSSINSIDENLDRSRLICNNYSILIGGFYEHRA